MEASQGMVTYLSEFIGRCRHCGGPWAGDPSNDGTMVRLTPKKPSDGRSQEPTDTRPSSRCQEAPVFLFLSVPPRTPPVKYNGLAGRFCDHVAVLSGEGKGRRHVRLSLSCSMVNGISGLVCEEVRFLAPETRPTLFSFSVYAKC
jgi:hypothetical protein